MGRKPNQAIRHFFERGPKLNDSSNRYQQTCKRCGERFEKGRQEALVAHIAKTCVGVRPQERERFVTEVQQSKSNAAVIKTKRFPATPDDRPADAPALSGLEALAEVSRRHGQQSLQNDLLSGAADFMSHATTAAPPILPVQISAVPMSLPAPNVSTRPNAFQDASLRLAALNALAPSQSTYPLAQLEPDDSLVDYGHGEAPSIGLNYSRHAAPPVIESRTEQASSVDDLVDYSHGQAPIIEDNYTRHQQVLPVRDTAARRLQSHSIDDRSAPLLPPPSDISGNQFRVDTGLVADQRLHNDPGPTRAVHPPFLPMSTSGETANFQFMTNFESDGSPFQMWNPGGSADAGAKKVRGAFAPDRRTAVKEVRKKGACLRCRMLKKSCDSGDPCKECAKLENARMWKGQCVRTRLSHLFNVFSSTLFMNIAHRTIEDLQTKTGFSSLPGRLEVTYFSTAPLSMTFPCLAITNPPYRGAKVMINAENEGVGTGSTFDSKIHDYGMRLLKTHFENGRQVFKNLSRFMQQTLRAALTMQSSTLITKAIDLWFCVTLLAKPPMAVTAVHESRFPPSNTLVDLGRDARLRGESVHYVYIQLRRKLERACDVHFKSIMADLEKALIQRKQTSNFETFLGVILLLRSLERVCYMYKGFDHLSTHVPGTAHKGVLYGADHGWPLENHPMFYWQQGERFSDLLVSMVRLRKITPVMKVWDGIVRVDSEEARVREWYDSIQLRADGLRIARDRPYDDIDPGDWELRWIGKLFETS